MNDFESASDYEYEQPLGKSLIRHFKILILPSSVYYRNVLSPLDCDIALYSQSICKHN